jgi:hypothetical protein
VDGYRLPIAAHSETPPELSVHLSVADWSPWLSRRRMLLVVGRDNARVEVALRGVSTPLAVTEWRRLPAKVRQDRAAAEPVAALPVRDDVA